MVLFFERDWGNVEVPRLDKEQVQDVYDEI